MISFLKGKIYSKESSTIIFDVNGIGYLINVPSVNNFNSSSEEQLIFTYLYIREDRLVLYGFTSKNERDFFKILIDAPGIGPKMALNILADMGVDNFQNAVLKEDLNIISSISGIGKKMAKKIVLELKEKFKQYNFSEDITSTELKTKVFINDAIEALKALGYQDKEARKRVIATYQKSEKNMPINLENLIKNALLKGKND